MTSKLSPQEPPPNTRALAGAIVRLEQENEALRAELAALRWLAFRDPLTGLRNRRYFMERVSETISLVCRYGTRAFSIVVIDIDHFKRINDEHGHSEGDVALRWTAEFIRSNMRHCDVCCRWGGDEFVLLLPDTDEAGSHGVISKLEALLRGCDSPYDLTLSFGAATWEKHGTSADELFAVADREMYRDKRTRELRAVARSASRRPSRALPYAAPLAAQLTRTTQPISHPVQVPVEADTPGALPAISAPL